jgi:small subunit ribosomal protein S19e
MVSARDVDQSKLVLKVAEDLSKRLVMPDWAKLVKTGTSRERPPEQANWWFLRSASVLRKVYLTGPVGVERLRTVYGSNKRRGHRPEHFRKASGKVIRVILQDLERAGLIEKISKPVKGRKITKEGQRLVDRAAKGLK